MTKKRGPAGVESRLRKRSKRLFPFALVGLWLSFPQAAPARELTFEERVKGQEAIERVYWAHRIWPRENPGAKPPLAAVLSDQAIRARAQDSLVK